MQARPLLEGEKTAGSKKTSQSLHFNYTSIGEADSNSINNPISNDKLKQLLGREPEGADTRIKGENVL